MKSKAATVEDPYRNFKFRLIWNGRVVAGFSEASILNHGAETMNFRAGGNPDAIVKRPAPQAYEAITLERGITHDPTFEQWANRAWSYSQGAKNPQHDQDRPAPSFNNFKQDFKLELLDQAGHAKRSYKLFRCWPSEYTALPELDANGTAVVIAKIKLENEGWELD
ncbi:MAG: phage tail protein [Gammaproteobacteria bacterium]|nr:phage tail protein [Gammaproteobacteria bacterium]